MRKEYKLIDLIKYYLKGKISVVDVGVNEGNFLKEKIGLKNINKALMIDPIKSKKIDILIKKKFIYLDFAISNKRKKKLFYIHSLKHTEWSSLNLISKNSPYNVLYKKELIKPIKKIVQLETLDRIFSKNNNVKSYFGLNEMKIDILKIDCQSTTLEVINGTKDLLKNNKFKIVILAINPYEFYKNKSDNFLKILNFMNTKNYELINIANAHDGKLGNLNYSFSDFKIWTFDAIFINKNLSKFK